MKKLFKIRSSAIWRIMSDPVWKSPAQKYADKLAQIETKEKKYDETKNKETKTALKMLDDIKKWKAELAELEKNKDKVVLSKTCIAYLDEWIKENYYGRRKQLHTMPIQKWTECETEAIFVLNKALNMNYTKSRSWRMENEWATWHEDIDDTERFITLDTKVCASIDSFPVIKEELDTIYWRQGQGYMWLKGEKYKKHIVAKVLVNTPTWQIESMLHRMHKNLEYKFKWDLKEIDEAYPELAQEHFINHVYDKQVKIEANGLTLELSDDLVLPYNKRVHLFEFDRDDQAIERIKERVAECRVYLAQQWY